ncbi:MAG: SRPBCC family protein [Solirubrobacteraceae bacterium]
MAPIQVSIEIARPQDEVFAYLTDPTRFAAWQAGVTGGHMEDDAATTVGSTCRTTRRIGGAERAITSQVTTLDPPRARGVHGIDGPIRAVVNVTVEPADTTPRSRVTVDFEGHGVGKLLVPLVVRRQARNEMPANAQAYQGLAPAWAGRPGAGVSRAGCSCCGGRCCQGRTWP